MLLRSDEDLGPLLREARKNRGWSQDVLKDAVGVSRQWVSMVENGKTSVEFDLVVRAFHALGYTIRISPRTEERPKSSMDAESARARRAGRTPLTSGGKPLTTGRSHRWKAD